MTRWPLFRDEPPEIKNATERRMIRILRVVHELHKRGYQKLRVIPYMGPGNTHWRCCVVPGRFVDPSQGAWPRLEDPAVAREWHSDGSGLVARYTTQDDSAFFGWPDSRMDGVEKLATRFQERFGELCSHGEGNDWPYAGWYVTMLGAAERGAIPVAADDKHGVFREHLPTLMGSMPDVLLLPLPV